MKYLVVDDEMMSREYLSENLQEASPESLIFMAANADDAFDLVQTEDFDVAFLDIHLGRESGIDLARSIKILKPRLNIVFTTAYEDYRKEAFEVDASDYLVKPVSVQSLTHALDNLRYGDQNNGYSGHNTSANKLVVTCFGNFDVTYGGRPVNFKLQKRIIYQI